MISVVHVDTIVDCSSEKSVTFLLIGFAPIFQQLENHSVKASRFRKLCVSYRPKAGVDRVQFSVFSQRAIWSLRRPDYGTKGLKCPQGRTSMCLQ
jgi:hypothetical protein